VGKRFAGRGLGLAICKETLALFGGELGVESAPGEGSRFWFRLSLPLAEADAGASSDTDQTEEPTAPLTVLYADDHENNRVLVRSLLESQGHRCEVVEDGAQAVVAAAAHDYDLILMDIQMPVQDGVSATLAIRAMNSARSAAPILALTANTLDAQLQTYAAAGMDDVIEKPINVSVLFQKVAHWGALGRSDGAYRLAI